MDEKQAQEFGEYLRKSREESDISIRGLAERVGVNQASITRFERGEVAFPRVDILEAISAELNLPLADVLAMSGYPRSRALPGFRPYMRSKFSDLSPDALEQIEAIITRDIGAELTGPRDTEDEH